MPFISIQSIARRIAAPIIATANFFRRVLTAESVVESAPFPETMGYCSYLSSDGLTCVVGERTDNNTNSRLRILKRTDKASPWYFHSEIPDPIPNSNLGYTNQAFQGRYGVMCSADGTTVAAINLEYTPAHVLVFHWNGTSWDTETNFAVPADETYNSDISLSHDGNTLAFTTYTTTDLSMWNYDSAGGNDRTIAEAAYYVYVYTRTAGTWTQQQKITVADSPHMVDTNLDGGSLMFGMSGDGNTIVTASGQGRYRIDIYTRAVGVWSRAYYRDWENRSYWQSYYGRNVGSISVSYDGSIFAVGDYQWYNALEYALQVYSSWQKSGACEIYEKVGNEWLSTGLVRHEMPEYYAPSTEFASSYSLSNDGTRIAILARTGSTRFLGKPGSGSENLYNLSWIFVYDRVAQGEWQLKYKFQPADNNTSDYFYPVSLSGDGTSLAVSMEGYNNASYTEWGFTDNGRVWIYDLTDRTTVAKMYWEAAPTLTEPVPADSNYYPAAIGLSGDGNTLASVSYALGDQIFIHHWDGSQWVYDTSLLPLGLDVFSGDCGIRLSTDGNTLLILSGSIPVVYTRTAGVWDAGVDITEGAFTTGHALSGDGNTVFVNLGVSGVGVYRRTGGSPQWTWDVNISYVEPGPYAQLTCNDDATVLLVSNDSNYVNSYNMLQVYELLGSPPTWTLTRKFLDEFPDGASAGASSACLSKDGNTIAFGFADGIMNSHNRALIFRREERSLDRWTRIANIELPTVLSVNNDWLYTYYNEPSLWLSADGNLLITSFPVGYNTTTGSQGGQAYITRYIPENDEWRTEQTLIPFEFDAASDYSGYGYIKRISDDGSMVIVGCEGEDITTGSPTIFYAGKIYTYTTRLTPSVETTRSRKEWKLAIAEDGWTGSGTQKGYLVDIAKSNSRRILRDRGTYYAEVNELMNAGGIVSFLPYMEIVPFENGYTDDCARYSLSISDDGSRVAVDAQISVGSPAGDQIMIADIPESNRIAKYPTFTYLTLQEPPEEPHSPRIACLSGDGNTLFVGSYHIANAVYDIVYVYIWNGTSWEYQDALQAGAIDRADFGAAIATTTTGNRVIIGAPNLAGTLGKTTSVYVFDRVGTTWSQTTVVDDPTLDVASRFGSSVDISSDGTRFIVGAPGTNTSDGAFYVYDNNLLSYTYNSPLSASGNALGTAVTISGNGSVIFAGAPSGTTPPQYANNVGAVYCFVNTAGTWYLDQIISDYSPQAAFGTALATNATGSILAIGAPTHLQGGDSTPPGFGLHLVYINDDAANDLPDEPSYRMAPTIRARHVSPADTAWKFPPNAAFTLQLDITNITEGTQETITNLTIELTLPTAAPGSTASFGSHTVSKGTLNGNVWNIGDLTYGETVSISCTGNTGQYSIGASVSYGQSLGYGYSGYVYSDNYASTDSGFSRVHVSYDYWNYPVGGVEWLETYVYARTTVTAPGPATNYTGSRNMVATGSNVFQSSDSLTLYRSSFQMPGIGLTFTHAPPCVSPNGDWVYYGISADPYMKAAQRYIVHPSWREILTTPWLDVSDTPTAAFNWISISPDADATYMSYCANVAGGLTLYKRSGKYLDMLSAPAVVPDGTARHTSWDETSTYLAVAASGGSRCWHVWKRSGDTFTDISSGFTGPDNGAGGRYGRVAEFSPATVDGTFLFVGTNNTYGTPVVYVLNTGTDNISVAQTLSDLPAKNIADASWDSTGTYLAIVYEDTIGTFPYVYKRSGTTFTLLSTAFTLPITASTINGVARTVNYSYNTELLIVGSSASGEGTSYGRVYVRDGDTYIDGPAVLAGTPTFGALAQSRSDVWPGTFSGPYANRTDPVWWKDDI